MKAYTLKKKKDTEELHLFEGEFTKDGGCTSSQTSICQKMDKSESAGNVFACFDENAARTACAKLGRQVCGICASHLLATKKPLS